MTVRAELNRLVNEGRQLIRNAETGTQGQEPLSAETLAAIQEGLADIKAGRIVSWEEVKRKNGP
jgi:hypothetical protein